MHVHLMSLTLERASSLVGLLGTLINNADENRIKKIWRTSPQQKLLLFCITQKTRSYKHTHTYTNIIFTWCILLYKQFHGIMNISCAHLFCFYYKHIELFIVVTSYSQQVKLKKTSSIFTRSFMRLKIYIYIYFFY